MDFEKNVPEWNAAGTEPPASLKDSGFQAGYKPPAAYFNWFWHGVSACLKEIREKLSGHSGDKNNPHGVTAEQVGLGNVSNTSDSEKHVKFAQEAGEARKLKYAMTVRLNGGRTENTDQFTFDGSTSRTVNVTPEKIGAAEKDMSNVSGADLLSAATEAGVGIPIAAASSSDGSAYTATVNGVTELYNGLIITIIPDVVSTTTAPTLNVNGLGEKGIRLPLSTNTAITTQPESESYFTAGRPVTLQYDATYLSNRGAWKVFSGQRQSASDLYGELPSEKVSTGGTEGQLCAVNADGTISPNARSISSLGDGVTFKLTGTTLEITTIHKV